MESKIVECTHTRPKVECAHTRPKVEWDITTPLGRARGSGAGIVEIVKRLVSSGASFSLRFGEPLGDEPGAEVIAGIVRWYEDGKGYGFVKPDDGSPDVMLHAEVVRPLGIINIKAKTPITVMARDRGKGRRATAILSIKGVMLDGAGEAA